MITKIILKNFKCFKEETTFPLSHFNLLTGINGRGKSTLLQSLLVMHQSKSTGKVIFNGSHVNLGRFEDVKNYDISASNSIIMDFYRENDNVVHRFEDTVVRAKYSFCKEGINERSAFIEYIEIQNRGYNLSQKVIDYEHVRRQTSTVFWQIFSKLHYISADRIGPQEFYLRHTFTDFKHVGVKGQHTANILVQMQDNLVNLNLQITKRNDDAKADIADDLLTQTGEWLNFIFEGASIKVEDTKSAIVNLFLNTTGRSQDEHNKPSNVGFGFSHTLPIIVAGLQASIGDILIVENPEAHLHPRAQSRLTTFLAKVAKTGVQVYVETHSDHILNACRVAVLDEILEPNELNILYFQSDKEEQVVKIPVDKKGGIDTWPDGFFDQTDKDYKRLFGF